MRTVSQRWLFLVVIALVTIVIYSNVYHVPFVFDDFLHIRNNKFVRDIPYFFTFDALFKSRSLVVFTFALNYYFHGLNVFGYHLVNIAVHVANGFVVYFLALAILRLLFPQVAKTPEGKSNKKEGKNRETKEVSVSSSGSSDLSLSLAAFFAALIFVTHPLQTQAVTYIVQRYTSFAAFFYMGSVLCYIKARETIRGSDVTTQSRFPITVHALGLFILSFLCGFLAFKSKQNAASLPGAILLVEYMCFGGTWKDWIRKLLWLIPFFVLFEVLAIYSMVVSPGMEAPQLVENITAEAGSILEGISAKTRETELVNRWSYLCTQFNVLVIYLRLLILPVNQNLDYLYPFKTGFFDGLTPFAFVFLLSLIIAAALMRKKYPVVTLSVFWFFITLSVESSIIPIKDALYEHRLYMPLFGFALLVAWLLFHVLRSRRFLAIIVCIGIVVSLGAATYTRNRIWQDRVTLWRDVLEKTPQSVRAWMGLGGALSERGDYDEAMRYYSRVLEIAPDNNRINYNIALLKAKKGDVEGAIVYYTKVLKIDPNYAGAHAALAKMLHGKGDDDSAIQHYTKAIELKPEEDMYYVNLGNVYEGRGDYTKAFHLYERALQLNDRNVEAHSNIGVIFSLMGDYQKAVKHLNTALQLDPLNPSIMNNLGGISEIKGNLQGAANHYRQALRINPGFTKARQNLSRVLKKQEKRESN